MTNTEYDIIDELYFVTHYRELKDQTSFEDEKIKENLVNLIQEGLVKVYYPIDQELELGNIDIEANYKSYFYLASKKGLFEHNLR